MSQNQLVQARINAEVKTQASAVLAEVGLSLSDAVRIVLTRVARDKAVPDWFLSPNGETLAAMKDAENGIVETVTLDEIRNFIRENS